MNLHRLGLAAVVAFTLCAPVSADTLYIRNRPFKGHVSGVSKRLGAIQIDLAALTNALGLQIAEIDGNSVVHRSGETPALPENVNGTGKLYVNGQELAYTPENGLKMVSLKDFSDTMKGNLRHNAALGTVDFDLPAATVAQAGPGSQRQAAPAYTPPSKYQLIAFGADW
jgi:hypothetical protein